MQNRSFLLMSYNDKPTFSLSINNVKDALAISVSTLLCIRGTNVFQILLFRKSFLTEQFEQTVYIHLILPKASMRQRFIYTR